MKRECSQETGISSSFIKDVIEGNRPAIGVSLTQCVRLSCYNKIWGFDQAYLILMWKCRVWAALQEESVCSPWLWAVRVWTGDSGAHCWKYPKQTRNAAFSLLLGESGDGEGSHSTKQEVLRNFPKALVPPSARARQTRIHTVNVCFRPQPLGLESSVSDSEI